MLRCVALRYGDKHFCDFCRNYKYFTFSLFLRYNRKIFKSDDRIKKNVFLCTQLSDLLNICTKENLKKQFTNMHNLEFFLCFVAGLITFTQAYTIPGVPDSRDLHVKISRGSGTGLISFGYAVVVLIALALFIFLIGLILCYKRDRGIRSEEKTIFLERF